MLAPRSLIQDIARQIRAHLRSLIAFHLFFTLLASAVWVPLSAITLSGLLQRIGRPVLSNAQIADVALSPWGLLWLLTAIVLSFLVIFLQQAGMMLVVSSQAGDRYRVAMGSLWHVLRRFPSLLALTFLQVGSHLLLAAPFAIGLAHLYGAMLGDIEPYILIHLKPPVLWEFLAVATPIFLLLVLLSAALYFRWFLALPAMMLDGVNPLTALKRSRELTQGRRLGMAVLVVGVALFVAAIPIVFSVSFNTLGGALLGHLPERNSVLVPAMLAYMAFNIVATIALTFLGIAANSMLVISLYHRATGRATVFRPAATPPRSGVIAWCAEILLLVFALGQAGWILHGFEINDHITITAHRGSSLVAPENTLASMNQAIVDGADYLELDVRLSSDGQIVVSHDNNLSRLTGVDRNISDMTLAEIEQVDVGSYFGDAFVGERIPTFQQILDNAKDRIGLYVELKPSPGTAEELTRKVIAQLKASHMSEHAVIASLSPEVIERVKTIDSSMRTMLFMQFVLPGALDTTAADMIGLRHTQATPSRLRTIHGTGRDVAVWTVNGIGDMSRYLDMGVDNIITDRPEALTTILAERRKMSDGELLLVKLRNWLRT